MAQLLQSGSQGQDVVNLQDHLNRAYPTSLERLVADGVFGPKTEARVKEFQTQKDLVCDGIVGPLTEKTLIYSSDRISAVEATLMYAYWSAKRGMDVAGERVQTG